MDIADPEDKVDVSEEVEEDVPDKEEAPTNAFLLVQAFQINCGIQYIDFEKNRWPEHHDALQAETPKNHLVRGTKENFDDENFAQGIHPK